MQPNNIHYMYTLFQFSNDLSSINKIFTGAWTYR